MQRTGLSLPDMSQFRVPTPSELDNTGQEGGDPERPVGDTEFDIPRPLDVPWFGFPHDGYEISPDFDTYLRLRGRWVDRSSLSGDKAAMEGLISALTFGLLEAVMVVRIPQETLLMTAPSHPSKTGSVTTVAVSGLRAVRLMRMWRDYMQDYAWPDEASRLVRGRQVAYIIEAALDAFNGDNELTSRWMTHWTLKLDFAGYPMDHVDVKGSLALFVLTLSGLSYAVWEDLPEMRALQNKLRLNELGLSECQLLIIRACRASMLRSGWCPYTLIRQSPWTFTKSPNTLSFLCHLPPYIRDSADEHKDCTDSSCVFYTIADPDEYRPRHDPPSCTCAFIRPPDDDVQRILAEGNIPVIEALCTSAGTPILRVRRSTDGPYIAISHVWADGMGSTTEEGLPACQISRIAAHAQEILQRQLGGGAFWNDSLCIPGQGSLRKSAIKLMARTYKEAAAVVVMDASVRGTCSRALVQRGTPESKQEVFLRIALSPWMRRVWTLQEARLARWVYFEFADMLYNYTLAVWMLTQGMRESEAAFKRGYSLYTMVPTFSLYGVEREVPLKAAMGWLAGRTTTKAEDETVAVSSLLSLDVSALLAITGPNAVEERMRECLLQLRKIPRQLPMTRSGKLTLPNFGWAPRSLADGSIDTHVPVWYRDDEHAVCTRDGLRGWYGFVPLDRRVDDVASCVWHQEDEGEEDDVAAGFMVLDAEKRTSHVLMLEPEPVSLALRTGTPRPFDCLLFASDEWAQTTFCIVALRRPTREQSEAALEVVDSDGSESAAAPPEGPGVSSLHCEFVASAMLFAEEYPEGGSGSDGSAGAVEVTEVFIREEDVRQEYIHLT